MLSFQHRDKAVFSLTRNKQPPPPTANKQTTINNLSTTKRLVHPQQQTNKTKKLQKKKNNNNPHDPQQTKQTKNTPNNQHANQPAHKRKRKTLTNFTFCPCFRPAERFEQDYISETLHRYSDSEAHQTSVSPAGDSNDPKIRSGSMKLLWTLWAERMNSPQERKKTKKTTTKKPPKNQQREIDAKRFWENRNVDVFQIKTLIFSNRNVDVFQIETLMFFKCGDHPPR